MTHPKTIVRFGRLYRLAWQETPEGDYTVIVFGPGDPMQDENVPILFEYDFPTEVAARHYIENRIPKGWYSMALDFPEGYQFIVNDRKTADTAVTSRSARAEIYATLDSITDVIHKFGQELKTALMRLDDQRALDLLEDARTRAPAMFDDLINAIKAAQR